MQRSKLRNKKIKIIMPMILSLVLLTSFIVYWLNSQFQSEKEMLQVDLRRIYSESYSDVSERLTYKSIIRPIIHYPDTSEINKLYIEGLRMPERAKMDLYKRILDHYYTNKATYDSLFYFYETDKLVPENVKEQVYSMYRNFNITFNGITFQYQNTGNFNYYSFNRNRKSDERTEFVKRFYLMMVEEKYPELEIRWVDPDSADPIDNNSLYLSTFNGKLRKEVPFVKFESYTFYLIKTILPQIIFVLILLGLSAFALVFAYRSYLSQIKLNMLRSDFTNNITHELKIPVATAKAALEALQNFGLKNDKKKTEKYFQMMSVEMNRLDKLTNRVLEHSRLQARQHPIHKTKTNMNEFIPQIIESIKLAYPDLGNISYLLPSEDIYLSVDKIYVEGVIRNLIENSIKYGGEKIKIKLNLWEEESKVLISVIDNGPGIPEEYLSKIFDRFFRVPSGDKHNVKGFGLGLSFAALVMKQHNGSIKAINLPNKGCEFVLKFPLD